MYHENDEKESFHGKKKKKRWECAMKKIKKGNIMVKHSVYQKNRKDEV